MAAAAQAAVASVAGVWVAAASVAAVWAAAVRVAMALAVAVKVAALAAAVTDPSPTCGGGQPCSCNLESPGCLRYQRYELVL